MSPLDGPRTVLVQSLWKPMGSAWDLVDHGPEGYRFIVRQGGVEQAARWATRFQLTYAAQFLARPFLPLSLMKSWWNGLGGIPPDTDLVYAMSCLWFGKAPWVVDMQSEGPHALVGDRRLFRLFRPVVRRVLRAPACRGVVYGLEVGKQALLQLLGGDDLVERKTAVIPWAVPPKPPVPREDDGVFRLLFVASGNVMDLSNFDMKGGKEVTEAFRLLRERYPSMELVVRCPLTGRQRRMLQGIPGVRLYEDAMPWGDFERLWRTADVFVQPTHVTPSTAYLDAMSYGLPVVVTDVWGNPELVEDGVTGFVVPKPKAREYTDDAVVRFYTRAHLRDMATLDQEVVQGLVHRIGRLVEDPGLRLRMGEAGRRETEDGVHSLKHRNQALKSFLDQAVDSRNR